MDDKNTPITHELKDGSRIVVRQALLDDVKAVHAHLIELDVRSRALVFGHARLRNRGHVRRMVESGLLIAMDLNGNVIGHAAYQADPYDDPEFRDYATIEMSVAMRWRRRGVGAELLQSLAGQARDAGIRRFVIVTHRTNWPVLKWVASRGAEQLDDPEVNWHEFTMDV